MLSQTHEMSETPLDVDDDDDLIEIPLSNLGCCFWIPCLSSQRAATAGSIWWERISTVENKTPSQDPFYVRGWKRAREWSELVAGPKWKTFIRTFRRNRNGSVRQSKFQYDPLSYALNFDDGPGQNGLVNEEDYVTRDFSSRYAVVPASIKASVDRGKGSRDDYMNSKTEGLSLL